MQKRLHTTITNSKTNNRIKTYDLQLAEKLKKLTDEANELLHRLTEKHEDPRDNTTLEVDQMTKHDHENDD